MQIRSKAYLLMISRLRNIRALLSSADDPTRTISPLLIYVAVVLALLLAILEVDQHNAELQSQGLLSNLTSITPEFMGP